MGVEERVGVFDADGTLMSMKDDFASVFGAATREGRDSGYAALKPESGRS